MNKSLIKWKILNRVAPYSLIDTPLRASSLIEIINRNGILPIKVAEVGVWRGHTSIGLLRYLPSIQTFYAIDPWTTSDDYLQSGDKKATRNNEMWKVDEEIFKDRIYHYRHKVEILKEFSRNAVQKIEDASLDLVFIDGNHSYESVKEDIVLWREKVKKGGVISGHDIDDENFPGVRFAVDEIFHDQWIKGEDYIWWLIKK